MSSKSTKDIVEELNKKGLPVRLPAKRLPVQNKPNVKHKSKKDYDRKKDKEKLRKELND